MLCPIVCDIVEKHNETQDIFSFILSPKEVSFPASKPGQFNMLYVHGIGEAAISYSRCSDEGFLVHTIRAVGQVTHHLHHMTIGEQIGVRGPFGKPWPIESAKHKHVVLITGGIGLAPLRPIIDFHLQNKGYFRSLTLIYGARSTDDLIFTRDLVVWQKEFSVYLTVDKPARFWNHHVGIVTSLIPKAVHAPETTQVFMCGPEIMMRHAYFRLAACGLKSDQVNLSLERNMKCGYGQCGHCQWGPYFICKDGPVFRYDEIATFLNKREL